VGADAGGLLDRQLPVNELEQLPQNVFAIGH
jgi:hypothetical protein